MIRVAFDFSRGTLRAREPLELFAVVYNGVDLGDEVATSAAAGEERGRVLAARAGSAPSCFSVRPVSL